MEFTKNFSSPSCLYAWPKHMFLVQQQSNYSTCLCSRVLKKRLALMSDQTSASKNNKKSSRKAWKVTAQRYFRPPCRSVVSWAKKDGNFDSKELAQKIIERKRPAWFAFCNTSLQCHPWFTFSWHMMNILY